VSRKHATRALVGLAVSLAFSLLALRGVSFGEVWGALGQADYVWLVPAVAILLISLWFRAERWRAVFPPDARPARPATFWAMNVGYLANNVLPARAGELARALALSHESGLPRTHCIVTVAVERLFDVVSVAVIMLACWPAMPDRRLINDLALVSAGVLAVAGLAVAVLAIAPLRSWAARRARSLHFAGAERIERILRSLAVGLRPLHDPRLALPVLFWSLASWALLAVSYWCVMRALSPPAPWSAAVVALAATNFAQVVPSTAGALGVFEVAARASLTVYGVSPADALSYAFLLHAVNFVPFLVLGAIGMARLGISRRELRADVAAAGSGVG
jgi:uncharacterized protein (TIRG00374 family)